MKIACVQMDVQLADVEGNLDRMITKLGHARAGGAGWTIFPECATTGYCFQSREEAKSFAQPIDGPATQRMARACADLGGYAVFGFLEADGQSVFNALAMVGPNGLVASYRKIHLPFLGVDIFTDAGDRPFTVHDVDGLRIGMNICYIMQRSIESESNGESPLLAKVASVILSEKLSLSPTERKK